MNPISKSKTQKNGILVVDTVYYKKLESRNGLYGDSLLNNAIIEIAKLQEYIAIERARGTLTDIFRMFLYPNFEQLIEYNGFLTEC